MLRIKSERLERRLSQQEAAVLAKIGYADLSRIETGRLIPYPGHAKRLESLFGMPIEQLLKEIE